MPADELELRGRPIWLVAQLVARRRTQVDGVPAMAPATAMVRIFGAFLVVVGLALLIASVLQGLSGN